MIGQLPRSLMVDGVEYPIETDYRNILVFLACCNDPDYSPEERLHILLKRLFRDGFEMIPRGNMEEAAIKAKWFVDCGREDDDKKPPRKLIDWEQDESIIFPALNKVAGTEVRAVPYIHWWTFMGYFMEIEEGTFSTILGIRQKKLKGRNLEKWEQEFYRNNRKLCDLRKRYTEEEQAEIDYWNKLLN